VTTLDLVPVKQITDQARQVRFGQTLLKLIAWLLVGVGRLAYWPLAALWFAVVWCAFAVKLGWQEAKAADIERRSRGVERS